MPLIKANLKTQITNLFNGLAQNEDGEQARQQLIDGLTDIIDGYLKTATVNVTVATTGTAAAQTGTGTGTLS